jgi:hypothetical protein
MPTFAASAPFRRDLRREVRVQGDAAFVAALAAYEDPTRSEVLHVHTHDLGAPQTGVRGEHDGDPLPVVGEHQRGREYVSRGWPRQGARYPDAGQPVTR